MTRKRKACLLGCSALLLAAACLVAWISYRHRYPALPYRDGFANRSTDEWTPYGGSWRLKGDEMVNRSDEPGAMLITGSPRWSNMQMDVDVRLRSMTGDVGVILRVSQPEVGVDAFRGYYVGIRSYDAALVVNRSDHDGLEARPIPMQGGVQVGVWYHLHVVMAGCDLAVAATNKSTGQITYEAMHDHPGECIAQGRVGLRSTASGAWRHFQVEQPALSDLHALQAQAGIIEPPAYPIREDDYSRMHAHYFPRNSFPRVEVPLDALLKSAAIPLATVASLRSGANFDSEVRLRGGISFVDPIYLEDATGGVKLEINAAQSPNIGDEVQVVGRLVSSGFSPVFHVDSLLALRQKRPVLPLSVTPTEAASGAQAGSLIEVTGVVRKRIHSSDGGLVLEMADTAQHFSAVLPNSLFGRVERDWTPGSTLRVRGICIQNSEPSPEASFSLLVSSPSDISVVQGPPWWSGWRLVRTIALCLLVIFAGFYLSLRLERSKHRAIMDEREHLAHEMHDTLAQSFAGVGFYLQSIRRSLRQAPALPNGILDEFDVACKLVTETHREASASIAALHPEAHGGTDLLTQLERLTYSLLGGDKLPVELHREGTPRELSPKIADVLFQIGREAISNVLRHAHATSLQLSLRFHLGHVTLSVADNGVGMACDATHEGFGLQTMRRRCRAVGAELHVETVPGNGTTIRATAPCGGMALWLRWWSRLRRAHKTPN